MRVLVVIIGSLVMLRFPFLFGGTFIEGRARFSDSPTVTVFPFLFGGTFIEGQVAQSPQLTNAAISLPFRRDFH